MKVEEAAQYIVEDIARIRRGFVDYPGMRRAFGRRFIHTTACFPGDETGNEPGTITVEGETIDPRIIEAWISAVYLPTAATSGNGGAWWTHTVDRYLWVDVFANRIKLRVAVDPGNDKFPCTIWS